MLAGLGFKSIAQTSDSTISDSSEVTHAQVKKKSNIKNKNIVVQSGSSLRDITKLDEGYTALPGGQYMIKDFMVKGRLNLISVTTGVAIASGTYNSGRAITRYYLQKGDDANSLKEVFLTRKHNAAAGNFLLSSTQLNRGMINTQKSTGGMADISKAVLSEMMKDNSQAVEKVGEMDKVTVAKLKQVVKFYNSK